MSSQKGLYTLLRESNRIKEEKYKIKPTRCRQKATGWMWQAEIQVTTKDDLRFVFDFWVNCHEDDGKDWFPNQELLDSFWRVKFVPQERPDSVRTESGKLVDATWHLVYVGNHVYVSKSGFVDTERFDMAKFESVNVKRSDIEKSITSGAWKQNEDIWMIV
jgi:hypothetical protein